MRAIFESDLKSLVVGEKYLVKDESFHHLANVVRVKLGEDVKIFNGMGLEAVTVVNSIEKKQLTLLIKAVTNHPKPQLKLDVFLGTPKKEAMELCLKQAVELGVSKVYLAETDYAQKRFLSPERQLSLMVSSLEQSNNPYLPEIEEIGTKKPDLAQYDQVILFDSAHTTDLNFKTLGRKFLIVLGPEGGFSDAELDWWRSSPQTVCVHLPTAIMRTPTALSCAIGFTLGKLN